jgi:hypothetical protein
LSTLAPLTDRERFADAISLVMCQRIAGSDGTRTILRAHPVAQGTFRPRRALLDMAVEFNFTPELRLADGRIIRNIEDALAFAREHEPRPGVDMRDEILHALERARTCEQAHAAAHLFLRWLEELELVV